MVAGLDINRSRLAWLVVGGFLTIAMAYIVQAFVGTFVFGVFLYYATRPVYRRMNHRIGDRRVAAAASLTVLALPILLLFSYAMAIGLQELTTFIEQYEGTDIEQLQMFLGPYINVSASIQNPEEFLRNPDQFLDQPGLPGILQAVFEQGLGVVQSVGGFIGNALLHLFIMVALAYYLLVDGRRLSRWFQSVFADDRGVMDQFVADVDRDFENVFFGNILNAIITGVIGALVYSLLDIYLAPAGVNLPYAALLGLLTGAASLVPVVGMKIIYVPATLYLFALSYTTGGVDALWFPVLFGVVSFLIVDVLPDLGLRPYVSGRNLHTGSVMLAYIFGPLLFGWYGLFLGPILLVLAVHFSRIVVPELVDERRFAPYSIDPGYMSTLGAEREGPPGRSTTADDGTGPGGNGDPEGGPERVDWQSVDRDVGSDGGDPDGSTGDGDEAGGDGGTANGGDGDE